MNIEADIRNLGKWLNEEQTAPIDRQALARLLAWAQMADKPAAWVYPEFFEGITKAGCWTAYSGDGSAAADGVKRIPLYRGARPSQLHTGCHRSHPHENMDSMCELRTEIARLANENARLKAQQQDPVGRTDQEIVDETEVLAKWLMAWSFNHHPATNAPIRESEHPFAKSCWAAACHIQEMLTATDPENAVAELEDAPQPSTSQADKAQSFPQEAAAFKAWFDAWWLGDGEQGETIPGQSDPHFLTYIDQYTLGFGAWMAAKHAAKAGA